ncbi:DUF6858 family protein [Hydrogenimonas thermophila]|uniref:Uncharacterized protein n=1 Tax=Hydrogenimonas thermophila TaxID=223786 RepID=A0A1I5LMZ5_9BACT|nr:hypothetical protein [Hydrogenimonas thermophila]SFO98592.1 hypothetical protein SAMN05216234_10398 [Hydrogenimonas thermophila]
MTQKIFKEKYPIYELIIDKSETTYKTVDEIINYFKGKIEEHPVTAYIAIFDHYAHTSSLSVGNISENIKDAKNIVFCFGKELPTPEVMAVRPRSIGVTDIGDKFVIIFMEAPNPQANETMENWAKSIKNI